MYQREDTGGEYGLLSFPAKLEPRHGRASTWGDPRRVGDRSQSLAALLSRCRNLSFPDSLPEVSIVFIFVNEALSVLLRAIHSAIARTPPHLLKEIILVDDNSSNGECPAPCPVRASQPPCRALMFYRLSTALPSLGCCLREERFTMVTTLEGSVQSLLGLLAKIKCGRFSPQLHPLHVLEGPGLPKLFLTGCQLSPSTS